MKKLIRNSIGALLLAGTLLTANTVLAQDAVVVTPSRITHDGAYDSNKHYYVDKTGYWDEQDRHQVYIKNEGHHGYWDTKGEKRVFITVGE
jgi:hypothetical protein